MAKALKGDAEKAKKDFIKAIEIDPELKGKIKDWLKEYKLDIEIP
jgi:hypothetical protein